jgi:hypothetical protein
MYMKRWEKLTGLSALALMIGVANVSTLKANDATSASQPPALGNDSGMGQENHDDGTRAKSKAHKRYTKKKSDHQKHTLSGNQKTDTTAPTGETPAGDSGTPSTDSNGIRSTDNGNTGTR